MTMSLWNGEAPLTPRRRSERRSSQVKSMQIDLCQQAIDPRLLLPSPGRSRRPKPSRTAIRVPSLACSKPGASNSKRNKNKAVSRTAEELEAEVTVLRAREKRSSAYAADLELELLNQREKVRKGVEFCSEKRMELEKRNQEMTLLRDQLWESKATVARLQARLSLEEAEMSV